MCIRTIKQTIRSGLCLYNDGLCVQRLKRFDSVLCTKFNERLDNMKTPSESTVGISTLALGGISKHTLIEEDIVESDFLLVSVFEFLAFSPVMFVQSLYNN